jgi:Na+/melibiose symporter-like transporter
MSEQKAERKPRDWTSGTYTGNKVPKRTSWVYSMSGIFRDACYALISGSFLNYAKTAGLLDTGSYNAQMGVIIALYVVCLIWDGFNDPIMGLIIEKTHFKTGKFRPWILIGAIGNTAMLLLMFLTKPTGWWFVACFGIYYFLWDFVFTMNDIGYWSMLPSLSNDEKERNRLTTMVTVATTIGSTAMYVCTGLLVSDINISYIYGYIAIPVSILFLLSQTAVFFFCKEKARDPKQDAISDKTKFKDLFVMVKKNKPLRAVVIAIFFYYTLGAILTTFGYDYFYFTYGYGGEKGGSVATYFLAVYILGTLLAQCFYTLIAKKFSQMTILKITFYVAMVSFVAFFVLAVPFSGQALSYSPIHQNPDGSYVINVLEGTATSVGSWAIFIPVLFFSAALGVFYLALLVMMQNAIDYNEYQFGERKESVAFAWRPLDAKLSAAFKWLIYIVALATTGTLAVYNTINDVTSSLYAKEIDNATASTEIQTAIDSLVTANRIGYDCWFIGGMAACLIVAYLFVRLGFHLNEKEHAKMVIAIEETHKADEQKAASAAN